MHALRIKYEIIRFFKATFALVWLSLFFSCLITGSNLIWKSIFKAIYQAGTMVARQVVIGVI